MLGEECKTNKNEIYGIFKDIYEFLKEIFEILENMQDFFGKSKKSVRKSMCDIHPLERLENLENLSKSLGF